MLNKLYHKGISAYAQGQLKEASQHLASYVAKSGKHVDAWKILGICYFDLNNYDKAIQAFQKAIHLHHHDAETWFNLGLCHVKNQNFNEAIHCYNTCVQQNPQHWKSHAALGDTHRALNQVDEAINHYMAAIHLRGLDDKALLFKMSQALLVKGAWKEGLELFETRIALDTTQREHVLLPRLQGQDIQGKRILVECEQGFGDSIQFSRYLNILIDAGAQVLLACPIPLQELFRQAFPSVQIVSPNQHIELSTVDYYIPLMSLAWLFQTKPELVPYTHPYLSAPQANRSKWQWLEQSPHSLKVGLAWSGNPTHKNDSNRSIGLEKLLKALPKNLAYFAVQKNDGIHHLQPHHHNITNLSQDIQSFADTAAICEKMDVIITVDTSIAHLCGSLGVRTWVLLPFSPDWRWLLERDDSVWYDSVRLFRQSTVGTWDTVLSDIQQELATLQQQ